MRYLIVAVGLFFVIRLWWQKETEQRAAERLNEVTAFNNYQTHPQSTGNYRYTVKEPQAFKELIDSRDTLWHKDQSAALWELLRKVTYQANEISYQAYFPEELRALEGKRVTIKGFMIPLEEGKQTHFVLSYFPYASCFFCGGAGPESVVEVYAKEPIAIATHPVTIPGTLRLNHDNSEQLFFIVEDALLKQ